MEMTEMIAGLSALAQPTRFRCVAHLAEHGQCSAGDLAMEIGVPANTMSSHLTILSHAGLVTSVRSGRHIVYQAKVDQVAAIREALAPLSGKEHGPA